jgi:hypothetical protein
MYTSSIPCKICGAEDFRNDLTGDIGERMRREIICHACAFWLTHADNGCPLVIKHHVYVAAPETEGRRGMAGRRFEIEYLDGRRVTAANLWSRGLVPERFRALIPDTARFAAWG